MAVLKRPAADLEAVAGVIHTFFEKGFIKAGVIGFADLVETGSITEPVPW